MTTPYSRVSGDPLDRERRDPVVRFVALAQRPQVDVGERVARDDQERVVLAAGEEVGDVANAAGGAEELLLLAVGELDPERRAVAEVVADPIAEVGEVGDHLAEAVPARELEDVLHHRPVDDRRERLRDLEGERPQPLAEPRSEDHRAHRTSRLLDATAVPLFRTRIQNDGGTPTDGHRHPGPQGRRHRPRRVRPQGDHARRARDAGPDADPRGVRRRPSR